METYYKSIQLELIDEEISMNARSILARNLTLVGKYLILFVLIEYTW